MTKNNSKTIETKFGLYVFRLKFIPLFIVKIILCLVLYQFSNQILDAILSGVVTSRGNEIAVSVEPVYFSGIILYYALVILPCLWMLTLGLRLESESTQ